MSRTLVIGLDSADAQLIEQWCDEGFLPTLNQLRTAGTWASLNTTAEVMHVSAWPTIYTGVGPGHHGLYHAYQVRAGEQGFLRTRPELSTVAPFWKFIDQAGLDCIVMDAFMDSPLRGFRGIQILEYGTWTWFTKPGATPRAIWREIQNRFGNYPAPEHTQVLEVPEPRQFRDQLVAGAEVKAEIASWLLAENPWDFAFVTFGEPHAAGHFLWHMDDETYPAHPRHGAPGLEHPMRDVYVAVDSAIESILATVDDSTTVIITSGDGMGPNYAGCHLMPRFLNKLGLLNAASLSGGDIASETEAREAASSPGMLSRIRQAIPLPLRHAVSSCLPRALHYRMSMRWLNSDIDWSTSRAVCLPNANEGYFRVNLAGREPTGIVSSGHDYEDLLSSLSGDLQQLVNPLQGGQSAVKEIFQADELFAGPERPNLPDLIATWNPDAQILSELYSERAGTIQGRSSFETSPFYSGNHRPNAFLLATGPATSSGSVLEGGSILDVAPTVLANLNVEIPAYFEGRALREVTGA